MSHGYVRPMVAVVLALACGAPFAQTSDLIISEYIEGSGSNKSVEIYNGTGAPVALGDYKLELYSNGSASVSQTLTLSGNLPDNDVVVVSNAAADAAILAVTDIINNAVINFNGDDALVLRLVATNDVVDSLGLVGIDPGTEWGVGLTSTENNTLVRQDTVCAGDTVIDDAFDPATQYNGFAQNTFGNLGAHVANCVVAPQPTLAIDDVTQAEGDAGTSTFTFTVTLTNAASEAFTVDFTTQDGSAQDDTPNTEDEDYVANAGTLNFAGNDGETQVVQVTVNGDTESEGDESFSVMLSNASLPAVQFSDASGTGTIGNDDVAPPNLTIADANIAEGDGGNQLLVFDVTLDQPAGLGGVSFTASTADGTATVADGDYAALVDVPHAIAAGNTSTTVSVQVNGDILGEPTETFTVTLGDLSGAAGADITATGTITDDGDRYLVWQVQGPGFCSPLVGACNQAANVAGNNVDLRAAVVTAVAADGFVIQTPDTEADASALTSNGILVIQANPAVSVGDLVEVSGTVREFFGMTEISPATNVVTLDTLQPLPTPVEFSDAADRPSTDPATLSCQGTGPGGSPNNIDTNFECFEGMLVNIVDGITTTGNQAFGGMTPDPYAEVHIGPRGDRAYREQGTRFPVLPAPQASQAGVWDFNPEVLEMDADRLGAYPNPTEISGGVQFAGQGIIGYEFSDYEFWPVAGDYPVDVTRFNLDDAGNVLPRPVRPRSGDEELTIGSFNAFRLCDIIADETLDPNDEILFDCDAAGIEAGGEPAYQVKLQKVSAYLRNVLRSPDVIGMQEVEKLVILEDLADVIEAEGGPIYQSFLIEGHDPGGIDVGFMVRTDRINNASVTQLRGDQIWDDPSGGPDPLHDRPPLLLQAEFEGTGGRPLQFAVLVNHTRSFDSSERGQAKRFLQALAIAEEVQSYQTNVVNALRPLILVGDHNAYQFTDGQTDPIGLISGTYNDESNHCAPSNGVTTCKIDAIADAANPDATQIVFPPLLKSVEVIGAIDADEVYSYIFTETQNNFWGQNRDLPTSQVIDHMLLTEAAEPLLVDFAYGRANVDSSRQGFNTGSGPDGLGATVPNAAIGSSDHDGFVGYFDTTCTGSPTADADGDSVCSVVDNCPAVANPGQEDTDGDGAGDVCDPNTAPTISDTGNQATAEDTVLQVNFAVGDDYTTLDCATAVTASSSAMAVVADIQIVISGTEPACSASITPVADAIGDTTITFTVDDGALTAQDSFVLSVTAVNDAPSFTVPATTGADEDAGAQSVPGFASAISAGPADEVGQALTFNVTDNSNAGLFAVAPSLSSNGTLSYTPAANAHGTATITLTLSDDGGGTDTSAPQTFDIVIAPQPDAPTFVDDPYAFQVATQAAPGTLIGTVTATDVDVGDTRIYSIQTTSSPDAVSIDPTTGEITVADAALITVSGSPILLTVRVMDSTGLSDEADVAITVSGVLPDPIFADGFED